MITSAESAEIDEEDECTLQLTFQLITLTNYPLKAECNLVAEGTGSSQFSAAWKAVEVAVKELPKKENTSTISNSTNSISKKENTDQANWFQLRPIFPPNQWHNLTLAICLTVTTAPDPHHPDSLLLITSFCQLKDGSSPEQLFTVIVEQVEVMDEGEFLEKEEEEEEKKLQVFFSLRNLKYPHKCVGKWTFFVSQSHFNLAFVFVAVHEIALSGAFFLMEPCTGEVNQLFYLDAVDYSEEMAAFKNSLWADCFTYTEGIALQYKLFIFFIGYIPLLVFFFPSFSFLFFSFSLSVFQFLILSVSFFPSFCFSLNLSFSLYQSLRFSFSRLLLCNFPINTKFIF